MLYPELASALEDAAREGCPRCVRRTTYGAMSEGQFGGAIPCDECCEAWREYVISSSSRHAAELSLHA